MGLSVCVCVSVQESKYIYIGMYVYLSENVCWDISGMVSMILNNWLNRGLLKTIMSSISHKISVHRLNA